MSVNPTGKAEEALEENELKGKVQTYGIGGICDELPSQKLYHDKKEFERLK